MDCSPLGSSVHGILQARKLEWVVTSFSRESSRPKDQTRVFCTAGSFFIHWARGKPKSSHAATKDPACCKRRCLLQQRWKILPAAAKTQHSQINKYFKKYKVYNSLHSLLFTYGMIQCMWEGSSQSKRRKKARNLLPFFSSIKDRKIYMCSPSRSPLN